LLACLPSAVRVFFGRWAIVRFFLAAATAFLMFFRAAARCFSLAIMTSSGFLSAWQRDVATRKSRRPNRPAARKALYLQPVDGEWQTNRSKLRVVCKLPGAPASVRRVPETVTLPFIRASRESPDE